MAVRLQLVGIATALRLGTLGNPGHRSPLLAVLPVLQVPDGKTTCSQRQGNAGYQRRAMRPPTPCVRRKAGQFCQRRRRRSPVGRTLTTRVHVLKQLFERRVVRITFPCQ